VPPHYTPGGTFHNKVRSCDICRALNVEKKNLSQLRDHSHIGLAMCPEDTRQVLLAKSSGRRLRGPARAKRGFCLMNIIKTKQSM